MWKLIAIREDGFAQTIHVQLPDADSEGLNGDWFLGPGQSTALVAIHADAMATPGPRSIRLMAESKVDDVLTSVPVHGATITRNAARLTEGMVVGVGDPMPLGVELAGDSLTAKPDGEVKLIARCNITQGTLTDPLKIEFPSLPSGWKPSEAVFAVDQDETEITITVPKDVQPGHFTITARGSTKMVTDPDESSSDAQEIAVWTNSLSIEVTEIGTGLAVCGGVENTCVTRPAACPPQFLPSVLLPCVTTGDRPFAFRALPHSF